MGFSNALNTLWGAVAQPFIGKLLDLSSNTLPVVENAGERVFTISQYQHALISLPIGLTIGLIILFFIKETYCRPVIR